MTPTGRSIRWMLAAGLLLVVPALVLAAAIVFAWMRPPLDLARAADTSPLVLAEHGSVLRAYLTGDQKWRLRTRIADVPKSYLDALVAFEDRRFWQHWGVDPWALLRAGVQVATTRGRAAGASTLSMQVARLLRTGDQGRFGEQRGLTGKLGQIADAIALEWRLSKPEILDLYLTLAPLGSNIEGVRAASLIYLGREPASIEPHEAALLIAIAQSPARRRPDRHPEAARIGRDRVLARAIATGAIEPAWGRRIGAAITVSGPTPQRLAAQFADRLVAGLSVFAENPKVSGPRTERGVPGRSARPDQPRSSDIPTRIDAALQARTETLARQSLVSWPAEMNSAVLVVRNADCAVRAYVGGADYLDADNAGQFDHVRAVRSPGSTLKPLIYGLAFEDLAVHPLTVITDQPVQFEGYAPRNFHEGYQGDMTVREALIRSINTSAVTVLSRVGPPRLLARLRTAGIAIRTGDADSAAGLAIGLGGGGMSLEGLVRLFSGLARGGIACGADLLNGAYSGDQAAILDPAAAWAVADILADVPPPAGFSARRTSDGGRRIGYKTGTSYGFRDTWSVGFDAAHTVGVWLGRSDGAPTLGATGAGTAAPLMARVFDLLPAPSRDAAGPSPAGHVLARTTDLPERLRQFGGPARLSADVGPGSAPGNAHGLRILFPRDAGTVSADAANAGGTIPLVAAGGAPPYYWYVDGRPIDSDGQRARWQPPGSGQVTAMVVDGRGEQIEVSFWVK